MASKLYLGYSLASVICSEFQRLRRADSRFSWEFGRPCSTAMQLKFRLPVDYDAEDGYRNLELILYGPMNYVAVLARADWTVVPAHAVHEDGVTEDYTAGHTPLHMLAYHDSGWRDALQRILLAEDPALDLNLQSSSESWYTVIDETTDLLLECQLCVEEDKHSTLPQLVEQMFQFPRA